MAEKKTSGRRKKASGNKKNGGKTAKQYVRAGETVVKVSNFGLEVWLYDDANREAIRRSGAMNFMSGPTQGQESFAAQAQAFSAALRGGLLVGYSLWQDDELHVAVIVGNPLTKKEMSAARWLEPQRAFLRLPSGKLCVESNDACRIGPEKPGRKAPS